MDGNASLAGVKAILRKPGHVGGPVGGFTPPQAAVVASGQPGILGITPGPLGPGLPYLEGVHNSVASLQRLPGSGTEPGVYEVKSCGCRSGFCPRCCKPMGYALRDRLVGRLRSFQCVYMVALTLDPELFPDGPESAFEYVRERRCVSEFVRQLKRWGFLASERYFYVIEWQENGWPHWHLVLDASFIPFNKLCDAWNRFRPASAGPVKGSRPGFGSLCFRKKYEGPESAERAARYVSKYLTKHPQHGYPSWVLDARYRIRRYSASRGFWGESAARDRRPDDQIGPEEIEQAEGAEDDEEFERKPAALSIRERLARCGEHSAVFRIDARVDPGTGELIERREFVCRVLLPLAEVREALWGAYEAVHPYCVRVNDDAGRLALGELLREPGLS